MRWPRNTLYSQKLALTSPISGSRSVGIVRSRTKATEFSLVIISSGGNINEWISKYVESNGSGPIVVL
jgi:hypothetical protein